MSFGSSSILANKLLAWSMGSGGRGYVRIQFPFDLAWCRDQPSTTFPSFQHRKETKGLRHEFIVLQMTDGSICRVERMGDPNARINALSAHGSIAYDIAQCFRPDCITEAGLDTSIVVSEVQLPRELDLKDVLNICRAIQEAGKTRNYTLQTFNCYFFSIALQSCLVRLVANWENEVIYDHDSWKLAIEDTAMLLPCVDPRKISFFRACYLLRPHLHAHIASVHLFSLLVHTHFCRNTSGLIPQDVVDEVFWYHKLGAKLDNIIIGELERAWWAALEVYLDWIQRKREGINLSRSSRDSELESLVRQCVSVLRGLIQFPGAHGAQNCVRFKPRRLQSTSAQNSRSQAHISEMDYRRGNVDDFERVQALTVLQWVAVVWIHAGQIMTQLIGLIFSLLIGLWATESNYLTYIDTELEYMISDLDSFDDIQPKDLIGFLNMLNVLRKTSNLAWKELPWTLIQREVQKSLTSSPSLGSESVSINVSLEGNEPAAITVSAFQKHIIKRIELQAKLVQQVGLGCGTTISTEIQDRLTLVWATIRNDDSDASYFNSSLQDPTCRWICNESTSPMLHIPAFLSTQGSVEQYVNDALNVLDQNVRQVKCSLCQEKRASKVWEVKPSSLMHHVLSHFEIKSYCCPDCGKAFITRDQRRKHMGKRHGRNTSETLMLDSLVGQLISL